MLRRPRRGLRVLSLVTAISEGPHTTGCPHELPGLSALGRGVRDRRSRWTSGSHGRARPSELAALAARSTCAAIWPRSTEEVAAVTVSEAIAADLCLEKSYAEVFEGDERFGQRSMCRWASATSGGTASTYVRQPPLFGRDARKSRRPLRVAIYTGARKPSPQAREGP